MNKLLSGFQAEDTGCARAWRRESLTVGGMGGQEGGGVQAEAADFWVLIQPSGEGLSSLGPSLGWMAVVGSLPRTCQPPLALPFSLNFLPETRGRGDDSRAAAPRCILIQHRVPAGCSLAARISGDVWSCCWLEREVGEIIMSTWEEIWAQAEASFFQLWEKRWLLSILPQTGVGWGRVFNPFLLNALCKISPQANNA